MIQVKNLSKYFGPVMAVHRVSFDVEKNEIVGLLGNNGAGKTTLMRILTTFLPATSGVATVAGFDVLTESTQVRQQIGYLPESVPLYPEMRVEEYLLYRAQLKGVDRRERRSRIDRALERCRIREVRRRLCGTLSKGYRQRVGLADAMMHDPLVLILDEPTDGLDPVQKRETLATLKELGQSHTIMLSSHLLSEVETISDRVIILKRGHLGLARKLSEMEADPVMILEVRGPVDQVTNLLRSAEGVEHVSTHNLPDGLTGYEVRSKGGRDLREDLAQRIAKNGWGLRRLDMRRRSLNERYLEILSEEDPLKIRFPSASSESVTAKN